MKKLLILLMALSLAGLAFADVIIGSGTSTGRYPLNDYYVYSRSQCIYLSSEISANPGTITALQWYRNDTGADPNAIGTTEIWLTETPLTTLSTWQTEGTLVATISNIDLGSGGGWYNVDIADFDYSGGNLMVSVRTQNAPYTLPHSYWRYTSTSTYLSLLGNSDDTNPPDVYTSYSRPNITFVGIDVAVWDEPTNHVTDFAAGTLAYTSIQLNWTGSTGAQLPGNYLIQAIKSPGTYATVTDGTPVANDTDWSNNNAAINVAHVVGANTYTFTGLTPNTAYEFKIWPYTNSLTEIDFKTDGTIPTVNASTLDPTVTPDYAVDFGTTTTDPFPPLNWTKHSGLLADPTVLGATGTGSWYQRDWRNIASPANKAAVMNVYGTSQNGWLITPPVDMPGAGYQLDFDLALTDYYNSDPPEDPAGLSGTDDKFIVLIGDGTSWTPANAVMTWDNDDLTSGSNYQVYNDIPADGVHVTIPLDSYDGIYYIAFYAESTESNADNDLFVDNVQIRATPTAAIFNLNPDVASWDFGILQINTTATQTFRVTNTGGAPLTFNSVEVTGTGFSPDPAFNTDPIPATQYRDFTVKYAPTAEQAYSGALTFNFTRDTRTVTLSGNGIDPTITYPDLPYATSFEDAWTGIPAAPLPGWTVIDANADSYTWRRGATYIDAHTGDWFAQGMGNTDDWMISPPIQTGTHVRLKWWDAVESASYPNSYKVLYSTTDNQPASFVNELADITCSSTTWTEHTLDFNNSSGTLYLAFHQYASGSTYWDFGIDDFLLEEAPAGPPVAPTLTYPLAQTGLPQTGFNLTWTAGVGSGPVDYYIVYFWADGETIGDGPLWYTTSLSLDPTAPPLDPVSGDPQTPIVYGYMDRWNWTVQAWADVYPEADAIATESWFVIQSDPTISIPHAQDFGTDATPVWPLNWTQSSTGSNVWTVTATANAGGIANEMTGTWTSLVGTTRLITPPINTTGVSDLAASFNTLYDDFGIGVTAKVQYSHDLATWYDTPWSIVSGSGDVDGYQTALIAGLVDQPTTYVAWVLDGDHFQYDSWYVDDVLLATPPDHDVGVVSWDYPVQVVVENTSVTPLATVGNFGLNTETFTVTCTIGAYSQTQTVTGLASFDTQQVSFPALTPALGTLEEVVITTTLATDTVAQNNTLYNALACVELHTPALANNAQTDQFVQFNLATPGILNPLPTGYTGSFFMSGGDWMNGNWMAVEYDNGTLATDNYYEIDPLTGVYLPSLGEPGAAIMGIAYEDNGATGTLYGVGGADGTLYTLDPATGLATSVAVMWYNLEGVPTNLPDIGGLMIACAYDNLGEILYGIDLGNDCLWTINTTTAELTLVGFFGVDLNYAQDAAFDQFNGMLFLTGYSTFGGLYWVDTTYGGAYLVGPLGTAAYELDGFAIPYGEITAPEIAIAATGALSWPAVTGAVHYQVYKATDPYGTYAPYATVYGTTWTDPLFAEGKAFYYVKAVGGTRDGNREPVQSSDAMRKNGKLGQMRRVNTGLANQTK